MGPKGCGISGLRAWSFSQEDRACCLEHVKEALRACMGFEVPVACV